MVLQAAPDPADETDEKNDDDRDDHDKRGAIAQWNCLGISIDVAAMAFQYHDHDAQDEARDGHRDQTPRDD